jgi:hypothetical protein
MKIDVARAEHQLCTYILHNVVVAAQPDAKVN